MPVLIFDLFFKVSGGSGFSQGDVLKELKLLLSCSDFDDEKQLFILRAVKLFSGTIFSHTKEPFTKQPKVSQLVIQSL